MKKTLNLTIMATLLLLTPKLFASDFLYQGANNTDYDPVRLGIMAPSLEGKNAQECLDLACNPQVHPTYKILAASKAFKLNPETGEKVAALLIFIAQNFEHFPINAADALNLMGNPWKNEAVQAYLAAARNPNASDTHKIEAALKAFTLNPETREDAASILIPIVKNSQLFSTDAQKALNLMGDHGKNK